MKLRKETIALLVILALGWIALEAMTPEACRGENVSIYCVD